MASKYPTYAGKAIFLQVVVEGFPLDKPTTETQLRTWVKAAGMPHCAATDAPGAGQAAKAALGGKDWGYLVEVATMKIIARNLGNLAPLFAKLDTLP